MRILLADNRPKTRFALRTLLKQRTGVQVVGEATDAKDLLAQMAQARPDVVLLDWRLRGMAVGELVDALRELCAKLYVIVLDGRPEMEQAALAAGANAFVSKIEPPDHLLAAIEAAFPCVFNANSGRLRYA
jgi:DNA-binding NarL/FixJ family response regulator